MEDLRLQLKAIFDEEFGVSGLTDDDPIFSANVLDSMDVLRLIMLLQDKYNITISAIDLTIEMLDSVSLIADYLAGKLK